LDLAGESIAAGHGIFLILALGLALAFEFVNGFHDTANAVATVIYTHTLRPTVAVVWSGCWNLVGVLTSSGAIAFSIVALLPIDLVLNAGSAAGFAMVFALLISAIIWNLGTWYLGLPASSSHTLVGAILGVGLGHSLLTPGLGFGEGVNWSKAAEVGTSLLISPIVGFSAAGLLLLVSKKLLRRPELFRAPEPGKAPPGWIRGTLVLTCTGVSVAHGSNDGQKGMGLVVLILVGILPGAYSVNLNSSHADLRNLATSAQLASSVVARHAPASPMASTEATAELSRFLKASGQMSDRTVPALSIKNREIIEIVAGRGSFRELSLANRKALRSDLYLIDATFAKLDGLDYFSNPGEREVISSYRASLGTAIHFIPSWVKFAVAVALGVGTMIGWKRIVVTVGEKIGKGHLTYAQGAAAELVAMTTIGASDYLGLPVSTTHVLSSGVAGTMAANHSGLQVETLRNLLLAWVLTLPVCVVLGASTFAAALYVVLNVMGLR